MTARRVLDAAYRIVAVLVAIGLLVAAWELYKKWGPAKGGKILGVPLLPRTDDSSLPHLSSIVKVFSDSDKSGSQQTISFGGPKTAPESVLDATVSACAHTLMWAGVGLLVGVVVGFLIALLMERWVVAERAVLPYVVLSQTVPLIAIAPMLQSWGHQVHVFGWTWTNTTSIELIATYLAFFPISIGMLRGLTSPTAVHADYFRVTAAGWWSTLLRLKLPASVRYLIPSLRLAAAAAVVGAIVAEISLGTGGVGNASGIGTRIWQYTQQSDSARLYAAVFAAADLGLLAAAIVTLIDLALWRYHRTGNQA